jgi:hypothetical protein
LEFIHFFYSLCRYWHQLPVILTTSELRLPHYHNQDACHSEEANPELFVLDTITGRRRISRITSSCCNLLPPNDKAYREQCKPGSSVAPIAVSVASATRNISRRGRHVHSTSATAVEINETIRRLNNPDLLLSNARAIQRYPDGSSKNPDTGLRRHDAERFYKRSSI